MGIARGRLALERAENQQNPFKCIEMLPHLEKDWCVVPGESDTLLERQAAVAAKMVLVRGARREALEEGLRAILGSNFISLRETYQDEVSAITSAAQTFTRPEIVAKNVRFTSPVGKLSASPFFFSCTVYYEGIGGDVVLQKGDILTVQPENSGLKEVVTVIAADEKSFDANFKNTHDIGAYATTANYVDWASTKRTLYVVAKTAAVINAPTVRKINDFLSRACRGITTWHIVQPTTDGSTTMGPFTLDSSPLSMVPTGLVSIVPPAIPDFTIIPDTGFSMGGTIDIVGRNLASVTLIRFDGIDPSTTQIISDYQIRCVLGPNIPLYPINGPNPTIVPVTLANSAGSRTKNAYKLVPVPPRVDYVTPTSGPVAGGTTVTAYGQGFWYLTDVTINGFTPVSSWTVIDDTAISFVTDNPGAPGTYTIDFFFDGAGSPAYSIPFTFV
jgi:hypothetical protein